LTILTKEPVSNSQEEVFVLTASFAQQRLWFLGCYLALPTMPTVIHPVGMLNLAALESSVSEIIRRHEALRTTFDMVERQLKDCF